MSYNIHVSTFSGAYSVLTGYTSKKRAIAEGKRQVKFGLPNKKGWFSVDNAETGNTVFSASCDNGYHWLVDKPR